MKIKVPLHGQHITIRNYEKEDLQFAVSMWFDEENGKYLSDPQEEYVDEIYRNALNTLQDSSLGYYLVIQIPETKEPVGTCCIFPNEDGSIFDIGYCIHKSHWKKGYATEAICLIVHWIKSQGGTKVTAEAADENVPSASLLIKCGFQRGTAASFRKYNMDVTFDSHIYFLELQ